MNKLFGTLGVTFVLVFLTLAVLWPLVIIWAVNTLFSLGIAYTFINWLAVLVLTISFGKANVSTKKDK